MNIIKCKDIDDYAKTAAQIVTDRINSKPDIVLGLPTGSTPVPLYKELSSLYNQGKVDFSRVTTYNLDEYIGLDRSSEQSYYNFMHTNLFKHINVKAENINIPNNDPNGLEMECLEYETAIKESGGIDLQVLGIGHNGHIGFNEPGTPFDSTTHIIELSEETIAANARFFDTPAMVPKKAISMGIRTIMLSKEILLLAYGKDKAEILKRALTGDITTDVPASVLKLHPNLTIVVDEEASSLL